MFRITPGNRLQSQPTRMRVYVMVRAYLNGKATAAKGKKEEDTKSGKSNQGNQGKAKAKAKPKAKTKSGKSRTGAAARKGPHVLVRALAMTVAFAAMVAFAIVLSRLTLVPSEAS